MAKIKQILVAFIFLLSFTFFLNKAEAADMNILKAPTLVAPTEKTITAKPKPLITGLVKSGADVLLYIDGIYNGKLANLTHKSGTANFAYKPFLNLKVGSHQAWAIAVDKNGNKTGISNVLNFKIELPMPAPTMYKPVVNQKSTKVKPFIVGLAKNNSAIKVFVDHKAVGQFKVENHPSGTANFAFKPKQALTVGTHLIYTTATDSRGKESSWSNLIYYKITTPAAILKAEDKKTNIKNEEIVAPVENKNTNITDDNSTNEVKKNQNKINGNLVAFILFLVGIVGWIFWVNRELIKGKQNNQNNQKKQ